MIRKQIYMLVGMFTFMVVILIAVAISIDFVRSAQASHDEFKARIDYDKQQANMQMTNTYLSH